MPLFAFESSEAFRPVDINRKSKITVNAHIYQSQRKSTQRLSSFFPPLS